MSNEKVIYCIILTITLHILIDCDSKEKEKNNNSNIPTRLQKVTGNVVKCVETLTY